MRTADWKIYLNTVFFVLLSHGTRLGILFAPPLPCHGDGFAPTLHVRKAAGGF